MCSVCSARVCSCVSICVHVCVCVCALCVGQGFSNFLSPSVLLVGAAAVLRHKGRSFLLCCYLFCQTNEPSNKRTINHFLSTHIQPTTRIELPKIKHFHDPYEETGLSDKTAQPASKHQNISATAPTVWSLPTYL